MAKTIVLPKMSGKVKLSVLAVLIAACSLGRAYLSGGSEDASPAPVQVRKPLVENKPAAENRRADDERLQIEQPETVPDQGSLEVAARITTQPGSLITDKSADLYAKVSGYLRVQSVDIGDRVEEGQTLAVIDMPELAKDVERDRARVKRAGAIVDQMRARVTTAKAELKASESMLSFRTKVFDRLGALARDKAMDMRVVDEKEEQMHAAEETKNAAEARILQAEADLEEALAAVDVEQATLDRAQVDLDYATIKSPYNGVITARNFFPGDFIRAADQGGSKPLLTVHKTDVMRMIVKIPDVDVPFVNPGDEATVTINNLPGMKLHAKVSRIAEAEDPQSRTMRAEIDLSNESGKLRDGMYGNATIVLDQGSLTGQ